MRADDALATVALGGTVETFPSQPPRMVTITAAALDRVYFAPLRFIVPELLPEGLALLAGKPKCGKSYLSMGLALAIASGGVALGTVKVEAGDVLYCALEDGQRRLQDRMRAMLPGGVAFPAGLHFATDLPRIFEGCEDALEGWLDDHPDARLVIIDTWRCIKPAASAKASGSAYDEDARGMQALHAIAKTRPGLAIIVVHHTRKMEADDVFDTISGTHGLTGVADTLMILGPHGEGVRLSATSRDMEGYEKALKRDAETGGWMLAGEARELAKSSERRVILDALAGAPDDGLSAREVSDLCGKKLDTVRRMLTRMAQAGEVAQPRRGRYRCPDCPNVPSARAAGGDDWDNGTDWTGNGDDD
jgi:hypothetical protein